MYCAAICTTEVATRVVFLRLYPQMHFCSICAWRVRCLLLATPTPSILVAPVDMYGLPWSCCAAVLIHSDVLPVLVCGFCLMPLHGLVDTSSNTPVWLRCGRSRSLQHSAAAVSASFVMLVRSKHLVNSSRTSWSGANTMCTAAIPAQHHALPAAAVAC